MKQRIPGGTARLAGVSALLAAVVACGGGGGGETAAPAVPPAGGPLKADLALAKSYDSAAKAYTVGTDNPIHHWMYRVWCETGYRTAPRTGVDGVDALTDRTRDLVTPRGFTAQSESSTPMPAGGVQFMDNAWYFGTDGTGMIVVQTPSGNLLMFDALGNAADMQSQVIDQMRVAGLNPALVTHIFIGHEHGDHYGGVNLVLRDHAPAAKVVAGEPAAVAIAAARARAETATYTGTAAEQQAAKEARLFNIPVRVDVTVAAAPDQDHGVAYLEVEAGLQVVAMLTPGHTLGQLNVIVPVQHKGATEKLLVWSGNDASNARTDLYASSSNYIDGFVVQEKVTAWFNTHAYQGALFGHLRRMKADSSYPNYIVMGEEGVRRWMGIFTNCNRALAQRYRDGTWESM